MRVRETPEGDREIELWREGADGKPEIFTTAKKFLTELHGEHYARRHMTLDRYLNRGRYARPSRGTEPGITVVGGFEFKSSKIVVGPMPVRVKFDPVSRSKKISVVVRGGQTPGIRGIDLAARGHEVAKLLRAGFNYWIQSKGYDFDDVLQDVYRKILVANAGKSPWSPVKSSFGHYVHMVCRSALSNFHRKQVRVKHHEVIGVRQRGPGGDWVYVDVTEARRLSRRPGGGVHTNPVKDLMTSIRRGAYAGHVDIDLACRMVPYVQEGHTLRDTAVLLGVDRAAVAKGIKLLRLCAAEWVGSLGVPAH